MEPLDANDRHLYNILMNQAITVSSKTIEEILTRLDKLTKEVKVIKAKLFKGKASYGSDEWWEKEIKESERELKKGKGIRFESVKDAIQWLNS